MKRLLSSLGEPRRAVLILAVVIAAAGVAALLVVLVVTSRDEPRRTPETVTIIAPPSTPLPDRVLEGRQRQRQPGRRSSSQGDAGTSAGTPTQADSGEVRSSPERSRAPVPARTTPKRPAAPESGSQPPAASPGPPAPEKPRPPVDVTIPTLPPVQVCVENVAAVNCP